VHRTTLKEYLVTRFCRVHSIIHIDSSQGTLNEWSWDARTRFNSTAAVTSCCSAMARKTLQSRTSASATATQFNQTVLKQVPAIWIDDLYAWGGDRAMKIEYFLNTQICDTALQWLLASREKNGIDSFMADSSMAMDGKQAISNGV
jgi:hypothetical protein